MTTETATFNPKEFELRNYTNLYVTPEQSTDIALVESRVDGQLDFLAQMLGWNGPNYWANFPETANQKRQLLGGSYGVYNGVFYPTLLEVRNWNETLVIEKIPFLSPGQSAYIEVFVLGFEEYEIQSLTVEGDTYVVSLGHLPQSFYDQIAANVQLQLLIPTERPAPFYRPSVGVAGDSSFIVKSTGSTLDLYPAYDTQGQFIYESISFFADSLYYFNQPVYVTFDLTVGNPDIPSVYDDKVNLWYIKIPESLVTTSTPLTVFLSWDYSDSATLTTVSTPVLVQSWEDNSDWTSHSTLRYFTGAWGNKGGPLPFNLAFDSLSIHGVSEENALLLPPVAQSLDFNTLQEQVYSQLTPYDVTPPGQPNNGDLWWNPATGALCTWYDPYNQQCAYWVEVDYRNEPSDSIIATLVYPNVASFNAAAPTIPDNTVVLLLDCNGLSTANGIIGLTGTITTSPSLYLYKEIGATYWTPYQFTFGTVADFDAVALLLPFKVPVIISDSYGLIPQSTNYNVSGLSFEVLVSVPANLLKMYTNETWEISPDSILRYISSSSLVGYPNQGEMWWDYANPVYTTRAASIYRQSAWVSVNTHPLSGPPVYSLDAATLKFYSDGVLLTLGVEYSNGDYIIECSYDNVTDKYDITYFPVTLAGKTNLPAITVSDSLQGTYSVNLTQSVFGGILYGLTPTVTDAETPLRLWKTQDLQDAGTVAHLLEDNYINPLVADINNGPNLENWERYFVRLPLNYGRNEAIWQKVALVCQNFGYWGSPIQPEAMRCPPESNLPKIYEELVLYNPPVKDYTYVYSEPYLYSNIAYLNSPETGDFLNSGFFPENDLPFDGYSEGTLIPYEPLHNRLANTTSPVGAGYGDWEGLYVKVNDCKELSGFLINDLVDEAVDRVDAPVWDASIYKIPPTCAHKPSSYDVDANHYKVGYAYFVADASAAEDGFFDPQQESAQRYPETKAPSFPNPIEPRTLYMLPRKLNFGVKPNSLTYDDHVHA